MTLNITIVARWGIWQSSDYRLTDGKTGAIVDDCSDKHVTLGCPDGTGFVTYTGLGRVGDKDVSDWLRELLRGETHSLDDTLILIREQASKWLGPIAAGKYQHIFSIGAFLAGKPWWAVITNAMGPPGGAPLTARFETASKMVEQEPACLVTGARQAVAPADMQLLATVVKKQPRRPKDYHGLLAAVNRRASGHEQYGRLISPCCTTVYMPPQGQPVEIERHGGELATARKRPCGAAAMAWD